MDQAQEITKILIQSGILKHKHILQTIETASKSNEIAGTKVAHLLGFHQLESKGPDLTRNMAELLEIQLLEEGIYPEEIEETLTGHQRIKIGNKDVEISPYYMDGEKKYVYVIINNEQSFVMPAIPKMLARYLS